LAATVVKPDVLFGYDHHLLLLFLLLLLANEYSALRLICYIQVLLLLLLLHVLNLPSKKSFLELGYGEIPQVGDCQQQVWVRAH
jgi:hypothetical protein